MKSVGAERESGGKELWRRQVYRFWNGANEWGSHGWWDGESLEGEGVSKSSKRQVRARGTGMRLTVRRRELMPETWWGISSLWLTFEDLYCRRWCATAVLLQNVPKPGCSNRKSHAHAPCQWWGWRQSRRRRACVFVGRDNIRRRDKLTLIHGQLKSSLW